MKSAPPDESSCSEAEASSEELTTDRADTSERPIIRAAPVAPVRRGFRRALRFARRGRPTGPNRRGSDGAEHADHDRSGRGTGRSAPRTRPAWSVRRAPSSADRSGPCRTWPMPPRWRPVLALRTAPPPVTSTPNADDADAIRPARPVLRGAGNVPAARPSARSGAARRAGHRTGRGQGDEDAHRVPGDRAWPPRTPGARRAWCSPAPRIRTISPEARPKPAPMPRVEPMTPSSSASVRTDLLICRRLAPSARSRPSSRVRWATRMLKVLMIRNAPTSSAIPAKPSSAARITEMKPRLSMFDVVSSAAVFTS